MKKIQYSKELNDYGMVEVIFYLKGKTAPQPRFAPSLTSESKANQR